MMPLSRHLVFFLFLVANVKCAHLSPSQIHESIKRSSHVRQRRISLVHHDESERLFSANPDIRILYKQSEPRPSYRRLTVLGTTQPFFFCTECAEQLEEEQSHIQSTILTQYPSCSVLSVSKKLMNAMYIVVPSDLDDQIEKFIKSVPGVAAVYEGADYAPGYSEVIEDALGATYAREIRCLTGKGIRVAVLDSGVDYTHEALGGNGTAKSYELAYGKNESSKANKRRDGYFPTKVVVDGYDFIGDTLYNSSNASLADPDDDPIDRLGHGTAVAAGILSIAPEVELIAVKVCFSSNTGCPDFAIVSGLEYVLDPNGDGDMSDRVHIVNLSIGRRFTSAFYSLLAKATEDTFALGVLPVVAAGNDGNLPYSAGDLATTPNGLSVGASGNPGSVFEGTMAGFSSRGPGESRYLKPDILAPGGNFEIPEVGTGNGYVSAEGTSFASPLVAGAAALLQQKCPKCSPFAIKALLMNNANHSIMYQFGRNSLAPVSWSGAGELDIDKALNAEFWAYSPENQQPSIGLGLLDVTGNMRVNRTIVIKNLSGKRQNLNIWYEFRDPLDASAGAVSINISSPLALLGSGCGTEARVDIEFRINATNVPSNHMTFSGTRWVYDGAASLDINEFDGWIVVASESNQKDISLPFHMILRQAANVSLAETTFPAIDSNTTTMAIGIRNKGVGVAQVDAFQLLVASKDDPESKRGSNDPPSDLRYVGYRTVPVFESGCNYLLEFAFTTWERMRTLATNPFFVAFDLDMDNETDLILYNAGYLYDTPYSECRLQDQKTMQNFCTGFPPDHATNTANLVLRMCTDDLGLGKSGSVNVAFSTLSFPDPALADSTGFYTISFPGPAISVQSFDLAQNESLDEIQIKGDGRNPDGKKALGLLLITNGFRSYSSTGAATALTEAIAVVRNDVFLQKERTKDVLIYPSVTNLKAPNCTTWMKETKCDLQSNSTRRRLHAHQSNDSLEFARFLLGATPLEGETCPEMPIPRSFSASESPTMPLSNSSSTTSQPSVLPTFIKSQTPSTIPAFRPSDQPSGAPTIMPSHTPTVSMEPSEIPSSVPSLTQPQPQQSEAPSASDRSPSLPTLSSSTQTTSAGKNRRDARFTSSPSVVVFVVVVLPISAIFMAS